MQFSLVLLSELLVYALGASAAAPINLSKRADNIQFQVCENVGYTGKCVTFQAERGDCVDIDTFNDQASSVRAFSDTHCCIYADYGCNGKRLCGVNVKGIPNLISYNFNDIMMPYLKLMRVDGDGEFSFVWDDFRVPKFKEVNKKIKVHDVVMLQKARGIVRASKRAWTYKEVDGDCDSKSTQPSFNHPSIIYLLISPITIMYVSKALLVAGLAAVTSAYRIDLWKDYNYQNTQRSYTTAGTHSLGFSAKSWIWTSAAGDGCCVVFCRGSTNVGKYCGGARKAESSAGTTKVVIGCGSATLNC
ncbi:hypothetical protein GLAREA_08855 [Glarea lozoyensis ATCC 20868]|uniref:Uncharacterized protein n=1 Tax=Glarea lozoyensis (strain ATCC 20868 / MF5171) TaxID=1116229 RepID=S3DE46_GLAL2|nr:uncharacterized protein GLAREA_08855 [Glarea lozoyensis ATCC 20868]EPE36692.1 hypothetical protein GLAREA_08855 [Glarea lozoyensis ATCC 20868]